MKKRTFFGAVMVAVAYLLVSSTSGFAAKGGTKGPLTDGGEEAGNNLSFPSVLTESTSFTAASFLMPADPVLGVHYSYGCDQPETDGTFSYPNTSCVNSLSAPEQYYTAVECIQNGYPCQGFTVEDISRIYWQKVDVNNWSADADGIYPSVEAVAYVDWGDALEAVSWNERSVIRVETQPHSSLIDGFDPMLSACADATIDPDVDCKVGFQMWHVSGQGINEQWGVRATEEAVSYNYDSPFRIINTGTARLNLAKMEQGNAECPTPGGGEDGVGAVMQMAVNTAPGDFVWDVENKVWKGGEGTEDPCTWLNDPYSVELSVGGKYVYGFNWRMGDVALESDCGQGWLKTGWWRLTYYTNDDKVLFDNPFASVTAPPAVPAEARELPREFFNTATAPTVVPVESDALYTPVVDVFNNLTYLDICIVAKSQGGGGGGGGGGNKPPAGGGGPGGGTNPPGGGGHRR
jgi:hypothetical protein